MSTIRELTFDEMKLIGGCGDGHNGGDRDMPNRGAPNSCANQVAWASSLAHLPAFPAARQG